MTAQELTEAQRVELEADLRELEVALAHTIERSADQAKPVDLDNPIGRLSRIDAIAQREISQAGRRQQVQHLAGVRQALAAIERDEYGLCQSCDEPIGYRRLKARPGSIVCVACQGRREQCR